MAIENIIGGLWYIGKRINVCLFYLLYQWSWGYHNADKHYWHELSLGPLFIMYFPPVAGKGA